MKKLLLFIFSTFITLNAYSFTLSGNSYCGSGVYSFHFSNYSYSPDITIKFSDYAYSPDFTFKQVNSPIGADIIFDDYAYSPDMNVCKSTYGTTIKISDYSYSPDFTIKVSPYVYSADYTIYHNSSTFTLEEAIALIIATWASNSSNQYAPMTNSSYNGDYMEAVAIAALIYLLFDSSSDKWKCPSGHKRDLEYGCVKGFVANLYEGVDAYEKGDYKTAIKHFDLLANNGSANAQFYIGKMYEKGISFKKNDYWAHHWINKAAQLGLSEAQYTLGYMYRNGAGVVKDSKQTVKWFNKAAKNGHAKAQFNLGAMYINGDTVDKSLKDAKYWIGLANKNGYERAQEIWDDFELWKY